MRWRVGHGGGDGTSPGVNKKPMDAIVSYASYPRRQLGAIVAAGTCFEAVLHVEG